jgi:hypothetical protein
LFYSDADKLLADNKKIFVKSPAGIQPFKNKSPHTLLTPSPAPEIAPFGTWLDVIVLWKTSQNLLFYGK